MNASDEKYERILQALRKSKPDVPWYELMEDEIMRRISRKHGASSGFFDFLFGWIYVSWVRRSLVAASFALLGFFLWQQNSILNQIDELGKQVRSNKTISPYDPSVSIEKKHMLLRLSQEKSGNIVVSQEDLSKLLDSINNLNIRYKDLLDAMDDYPVLKKQVEENLQKNFKSRIKL